MGRSARLKPRPAVVRCGKPRRGRACGGLSWPWCWAARRLPCRPRSTPPWGESLARRFPQPPCPSVGLPCPLRGDLAGPGSRHRLRSADTGSRPGCCSAGSWRLVCLHRRLGRGLAGGRHPGRRADPGPDGRRDADRCDGGSGHGRARSDAHPPCRRRGWSAAGLSCRASKASTPRRLHSPGGRDGGGGSPSCQSTGVCGPPHFIGDQRPIHVEAVDQEASA